MLIITGSSQKTSTSSSTPDKHSGGVVSISQEVGK